MNKLIILLSFLSPLLGNATWQARYGLGILSARPSITDVKVFSLAKEFELNPNLCARLEAGHWWDKDPQARNSFWSSAGIGLVVRPLGFIDVRVYTSLAGVQHTDAFLSSHLQFQNDISLSFRDSGAGIGLAFTHLSNAGLKKPNRGRNFMTMNLMYGF